MSEPDAIQFIPETLERLENPFDRARIFLAVCAYPRTHAGLPADELGQVRDGPGALFMASMYDALINGFIKTYGAEDVETLMPNAGSIVRHQKLWLGTFERGCKRLREANYALALHGMIRHEGLGTPAGIARYREMFEAGLRVNRPKGDTDERDIRRKLNEYRRSLHMLFALQETTAKNTKLRSDIPWFLNFGNIGPTRSGTGHEAWNGQAVIHLLDRASLWVDDAIDLAEHVRVSPAFDWFRTPEEAASMHHLIRTAG